MDLESKVTELRRLGYIATRRDWALGDTIFVSHPRFEFFTRGVPSLSDCVYLRLAGGRWLVTDGARQEAEPHGEFSNWEDVLVYLEGRLQKPPAEP